MATRRTSAHDVLRSKLLCTFPLRSTKAHAHTQKKISQRTPPTPPTQPTRLHQHNNRDEDERSSKDDLLETTTDRTRFAIQNHAGADRTTTNVRAMTTDESDFDFVTFSSQKNVEFSKIQTSNCFKTSSKKSNVKKSTRAKASKE